MYLNKWSDSLHSGRVIARPFLQSFFVISTIVISRVDRISQRQWNVYTSLPLYIYAIDLTPRDLEPI